MQGPPMPATLTATVLPLDGGDINLTEMVSHRSFLVRFARRKLCDPLLADDLVHDVFVAVMTGRAAFGGRSALRSWLAGILKNKLMDQVRDRSRYHSTDAMCDEDSEAIQIECERAGPEQLAEQRERLAQTLARIEQLPEGLRDVMRWRVLHDESTEAVCERLSISPENLFVRLHRARKQLM
jgi:RNA polymerase sigma-70 factor (ECF subfamily)